MGIFVKILNNFTRTKFGDELNFIMQRGNELGTFSVWLWGKNEPILQGPQVWGGNVSLLMGNWIEH